MALQAAYIIKNIKWFGPNTQLSKFHPLLLGTGGLKHKKCIYFSKLKR
jgi:hypothetical protein